MKPLTWLNMALALAVSSCGGSSRSSGTEARTKFESRTGIRVPEEVANWEFSSVKVGDTYGEYYQFSCTREVFLNTAKKLNLKPDYLPGFPGTTLWGRAAGESTPNDPNWWRLASASDQIYHKEDYSSVANRSVMAFWYHDGSGLAFMNIDFWD